MELKETFIEMIKAELDKPLEDYNEVVQKKIQEWPDLIYDVIRVVQKKSPESNYKFKFKLPCGSGALEIKHNKKSHKMAIRYYEVKHPTIQSRFNSLLSSVYNDIAEESMAKKKSLNL